MTSIANPVVRLKRPHVAQLEILRAAQAYRFVCAVCGRRFGKTEAGKQVQIRRALAGGFTWWISPSYPMSTEIWNEYKTMLAPVTADKSEQDRRLQLVTGGVIQVKSGHDPDALRGRGLDLAVLDEAAFIRKEVWEAAIRPALTDKKGSALFLSSPSGRNWFWGAWMRGNNPAYPAWKSLHFPTSANPLIDPAEIEEARALLPERLFKQEFLAEFLDDGGVVFRNVDSCATAPLHAQPEHDAGARYVFGVDWARDNDFTAIVVLDVHAKRMVAMEQFNQIGWALQRGRLAALAAVWKPDVIWAEANSIGGPNIEALQAEGLPVIPFTTTAESKGPLIESLALAFERGEITIQPDPVLLDELRAYSLERLASGRYRYGAPAGLHDDCVIALALAWHAVMHSGLGISFV